MSGPVNVGGPVFALKYRDGVMVMTDTFVTYGNMRRLRDFQRVEALGSETLVACGGEMCHFQELMRQLRHKQELDEMENDGASFCHAKEYMNYISRMQYQARCKNDPIWVSAVVAGFNPKTKEVSLGRSDIHGLLLQQDYVVTGLALYYCQVTIEKNWTPSMSYEEAKKLLIECQQILFRRSPQQAYDCVQFSTVTANGVNIEEPFRIDPSPNFALEFNSQKTNEFWRPARQTAH